MVYSHLIDTSILDGVDYFRCLMPSSRSSQEGSSSFVNVLDLPRVQVDKVARIEAAVTALQGGRQGG